MYEVALCLSLVCWLAVCLFYLRSRIFSVFHPFTFYALFHGLVFVVRPIVGYFLDFRFVYRAFEFTPPDDVRLTALLASNVGFLVFAFACLRSGWVEMRFKQDAVAIAERNGLTPIFMWVLAICGPIGLYSFVRLWSGDSMAQLVQDKATGFTANASGNGYLTEAQLMLASCAALWGWLMRFRLIGLVPMFAFLLFRAGSGGRGPFVTAAATMGLLWLYEQRRKIPTKGVITAVVVVAIVFGAVGRDRGQTIRRFMGLADKTSSDVNTFAEAGNEKFMEGEDLANLEFLEYIIWVIPKKSGTYSLFLDNLQVFTEPVPRALWHEKPVGAPFAWVSFMKYGKPYGMTMSLPGEGWYGFGWTGVVVVCGLWGLALGTVYRRFVLSAQSTLGVATYMVFVPILIIAFRDGSIVTIARQGLFFLMPVLLWRIFARYLGIPSSEEVRTLLAFHKQRNQQQAQAALEVEGGEAPAPVPAPVRSLRRLAAPLQAPMPPAVLRRRERLEQARQQSLANQASPAE